MLVFICESTFAVSRFPNVALITQLLETLLECMLGPCSGNQELVAKSDVVVAINYIIPSNNERDALHSRSNPDHMSIQGLGCLL